MCSRVGEREALRDEVGGEECEMRVDLVFHAATDVAAWKPKQPTPPAGGIHGLRRLRGGAQNLAHRFDKLRPRRRFGLELRAANGCQTVDLRAAVRVGEPPLTFDPAAFLETVERRVEGALTELERVAGQLLGPAGDGVPVGGPPRERLQNEEVEGTLEEIEGCLSHGRTVRMSTLRASTFR